MEGGSNLVRMGDRLKSAVATALIQGAIGYGLILGLTMSIPRQANNRLTVVNLPRERAPRTLPPAPKAPSAAFLPAVGQAVVLQNWATASPVQRNLDFIKA